MPTNRVISHHHPFGMVMPTRNWQAGSAEEYAFGFNGQLTNLDFQTDGSVLEFKYRVFNAKLGKFLSVDPISSEFPYVSPYAFGENDVISCKDLDGLERYYSAKGEFIGQVGTHPEIRIIPDENIVEGTKWVQWAIGTSNVQRHEAARYNNNQAIKLSKPYHLSTPTAQSNVSTSIYNDLNSNISVKSMSINSANDGTAASTTDAGNYIVYPNLFHQEFINDNYYNQLNVWFHEEQHSQFKADGQQSSDVFTHFTIQMNSVNHTSYSMTSSAYKDFSKNVLKGYLEGQTYYLLEQLSSSQNPIATYNSAEFQYYLEQNTESIKAFNSTYNESYMGIDFKKYSESKDSQ